jgi:hypothetical protein
MFWWKMVQEDLAKKSEFISVMKRRTREEYIARKRLEYWVGQVGE